MDTGRAQLAAWDLFAGAHVTNRMSRLAHAHVMLHVISMPGIWKCFLGNKVGFQSQAVKKKHTNVWSPLPLIRLACVQLGLGFG